MIIPGSWSKGDQMPDLQSDPAAVSTGQNNRDHRKILVIDGHTAYTGGVNLADEYINRKVRFGHWKDNAICIKGEAVRSFTVMFLQMWSACARYPEYDFNFDRYLDIGDYFHAPELNMEGYSVPFSDSPMDGEAVSHQVYLDILYQAKKYVYIMTPYLILDDDLMTALSYAAKRAWIRSLSCLISRIRNMLLCWLIPTIST